MNGSRAADYPLWADCPFAELLPEGVVARRGERFGRPIGLLSKTVDGKITAHVAFMLDDYHTEANAAEWVPTLVALLASR